MEPNHKPKSDVEMLINKISSYSNEDFKNIGLKCGLEIHQQLNTKKLFCNCPSDADDSYDFEVVRRLNMSLSETDEKDKAAVYETKNEKEYHYFGNSKTTCLVELDEEPPHEVNEDAFKMSIQAAKLFGMKIVDEIQVMRKIVLDGSNTTGFQRTMLVGYNGQINNTGIDTLCLEEDASKIISQKGNIKEYHLNRLGIPLIEVATDASINNPEQAKKVAKSIGLTLRSLNVKRGLGTIRQDVNVSIKGGRRVEIKGVQDLKSIPKIIIFEIVRQKRLLELKDILNKRCSKEINLIPIDVTSIMKESNSKIVSSIIKNKGIFYAAKAENMSSLFGFEVLRGKRFGTELAGVIKRLGLKGLFHSDELDGTKYGIGKDVIDKIKEKLNIKDNDAFLMIGGEKEQLLLALEIIQERINEAREGVPNEVRNANQDFTTNFLRPMPGSSRMYPETDVPPINSNKYQDIEVPEALPKKIKRYTKLGIDESSAETIAKEISFFDNIINKFPNIKISKLADIAIRFIKAEKKEGNDSYESKFKQIIAKVTEEYLDNSDIEKILSRIDDDLDKVFSEEINKRNLNEIEKEIEEKIKEYKKQGYNNGKITSLITNEYKSKTNPRDLIMRIKQYME